MGSEFSNADMSRPNLGQFTHKLQGSASLNGKDCWKVESTCLNEEAGDENGFSRKVAFIEKSTHLTWEVDFFDQDNVLFKKIDVRRLPQAVERKVLRLPDGDEKCPQRPQVGHCDRSVPAGFAARGGLFLTANLKKCDRMIRMLFQITGLCLLVTFRRPNCYCQDFRGKEHGGCIRALSFFSAAGNSKRRLALKRPFPNKAFKTAC